MLEAAGWTLQGDVYTKGDLKTEFSIGHIDPNPRRTNTVQLTISSCAEAGLKITDAPSATFFDDGTGELDSGNFDVALFAWTGSPLISGSTSTFIPDGGNNKGKWVNDQTTDALRHGQRRARPGGQGRHASTRSTPSSGTTSPPSRCSSSPTSSPTATRSRTSSPTRRSRTSPGTPPSGHWRRPDQASSSVTTVTVQ